MQFDCKKTFKVFSCWQNAYVIFICSVTCKAFQHDVTVCESMGQVRT